MLILRTWKEPCCICGEEITLREYAGLEGGAYTGHTCSAAVWEIFDQLCSVSLCFKVPLWGMVREGER